MAGRLRVLKKQNKTQVGWSNSADRTGHLGDNPAGTDDWNGANILCNDELMMTTWA